MGADPARELVSFAAKAGVSLIALATHGRTGLRRLALGSVSERIIRTADRPVLLANPWVATVPLEFKRVVLPLDGSERSEETFPIASELARHFGSRLVLVHVEALIPLDPGPLVGREHSVSVRTFERARRALGSAAIETIVKSGAPDEGVLAAISEATPDVVVATTHGRTGLARLACGSVTEALIRRSPVPVIVQRSVPALAARMSTVHHERASTE
jgi:nucleotide-binding universal stress UspA family protein